MAYGKHLDIPAGAAVRFEPGDKKKFNSWNILANVKFLVFVVWSMVLSIESRVYRPTDENDEYAGVFGDNGAENVNKKGGKRS